MIYYIHTHSLTHTGAHTRVARETHALKTSFRFSFRVCRWKSLKKISEAWSGSSDVDWGSENSCSVSNLRQNSSWFRCLLLLLLLLPVLDRQSVELSTRLDRWMSRFWRDSVCDLVFSMLSLSLPLSLSLSLLVLLGAESMRRTQVVCHRSSINIRIYSRLSLSWWVLKVRLSSDYKECYKVYNKYGNFGILHPINKLIVFIICHSHSH